MRFSQRIGKTPIKSIIQIEEIDKDLKNSLWNVILRYFFNKLDSRYSYPEKEVFTHIWQEFFKQTIDTVPREGFQNYFRKWFFDEAKWFDVYDFVEFIAKLDYVLHDEYEDANFKENCNFVLEQELSGYRIIEDKITPITSDLEVEAIEKAIVNTDKYTSVNSHLKTAIEYLSDKKSPDYRNCIKEAISAVESLCKIITGKNKATLGDALKEIEKRFTIHVALKDAFSKIYGYTSDSGGIRHSLTEKDIPITQEDAVFMLVACSAFINYLKSKIE